MLHLCLQLMGGDSPLPTASKHGVGEHVMSQWRQIVAALPLSSLPVLQHMMAAMQGLGCWQHWEGIQPLLEVTTACLQQLVADFEVRNT